MRAILWLSTLWLLAGGLLAQTPDPIKVKVEFWGTATIPEANAKNVGTSSNPVPVFTLRFKIKDPAGAEIEEYTTRTYSEGDNDDDTERNHIWKLEPYAQAELEVEKTYTVHYSSDYTGSMVPNPQVNARLMEDTCFNLVLDKTVTPNTITIIPKSAGTGASDGNINSVHYWIDLGADSISALGKIKLSAENINSAAFNRSILQVAAGRASVKVLPLANPNPIQQIKTPANLIVVNQVQSGGVDIGFDVVFYTADPAAVIGSNGLYPVPTIAPTHTFNFRQASSGSGEPQLKISETRASGQEYYLFTQKPGNAWSMEKGDIASGVFKPATRDFLTREVVDGEPVKVTYTEDVAAPSGTVVEITRIYADTASASLRGRIHSVDHPNGQRESYAYAQGSYDKTTRTFTSGAGLYRQTSTTFGVARTTNPLVAYRSSRTISVTDTNGVEWQQRFEVYDGTAFQPVYQIDNDYDSAGHLVQTIRDGRIIYSAVYTDGRKTSETDERGIERTFGNFNADGQPQTITKVGVAASGNYAAQSSIVATVSYDSLGRGETNRYETAGGLTRYLNSRAYDSNDRIDWTKDRGLVTDYVYSTVSGNKVTTIYGPDGASEIRTEDASGQLLSVTGTRVTAAYYTRGTNTDGTTWERVDYGVPASLNYTKTTRDVLGNVVSKERPAFGGGTQAQGYFYNLQGRITKETRTGYADTLYVYDSDFGELYRQGQDLNGNGVLDLAPSGSDAPEPIQQFESYYEKIGSNWYEIRKVSAFRDSGGTPVMISCSKERLNLTTTLMSERIEIDEAGVTTTEATTVDRAAKLVTTTRTVPGASNVAEQVTRNGLLQTSRDATQTQAVLYGYDALGRLQSITDPRSGATTTYAYDNYDRVTSVVAASATDSQQKQTVQYSYLPGATSQGYYPAGTPQLGAGQIQWQRESQVLSGSPNRTTYFRYDLRGNRTHTWGDTYPVWTEYDDFGRMWKLHTYRAAVSSPTTLPWPAGDITTWGYDEATGLLTTKRDAANKGPTYTYWPSGLLKRRTWARQVAGAALTADYTYYTTGSLYTVNYSDGTPDVTLEYHRDGRIKTQSDAAGLNTYAYDTAFRAKGETYSGSGQLSGFNVEYPLDTYGRLAEASAKRGATLLSGYGYGYSATTGLLDSVRTLEASGAAGRKAFYTYANQSDLVDTVEHHLSEAAVRNDSSRLLVSRRIYDHLGRFDTASSRFASDANAFSLSDYGYDSLGRRQSQLLADGNHWTYEYDLRNQVKGGVRETAANVALPGLDFDYAYDEIGNRSTATVNGQPSTYAPNALNQYDQRTVPGVLQVQGAAPSGAKVAVNNTIATVAQGRFAAQVPASNDSSPVYTRVKTAAVNQSTSPLNFALEDQGALFLAKSPEAYSYDDDGNLTRDGRWDYVWDAENRLVRMSTRADVAAALPTLPRCQLDFVYDSAGRRIAKKVFSVSSGGALTQLSHRSFLYQGWNLIAELDATSSPQGLVTAHAWGLDLSGSPQGVGGIAGLLWTWQAVAAPDVPVGYYAPAYDGNGNITVWISLAASAASNAARVVGLLEYAPFGEPLRRSGAAKALPFAFSSKYTDQESGLNYYGYRYYNATSGRWLSRDPIGEGDGANVYLNVRNNPVLFVDILGRSIWGGASLYGSTAAMALLQIWGDARGHELYEHYFTARGAPFSRYNDILWQIYLEKNEALELAIWSQLTDDIARLHKPYQPWKGDVGGRIAGRPALTDHRLGSGYHVLNEVTVYYKGKLQYDCYEIFGDMEYRIEDRADANINWSDFANTPAVATADLVSVGAAMAASLGHAKSFDVRISWKSFFFLRTFMNGSPMYINSSNDYGFPFGPDSQ